MSYYIIEQENNYRYNFSIINSINDRQSKPVNYVHVPGGAATSSVLLSMTGMERHITIDFKLVNDGTDKANGTYTSTVKTLAEQKAYLQNEIQQTGYNAVAKFYGDYYDASGVTCSIEEILFLPNKRNPNQMQAIMKLAVGTQL